MGMKRTDDGPPRVSGVLKVVATDEQRPCEEPNKRSDNADFSSR